MQVNNDGKVYIGVGLHPHAEVDPVVFEANVLGNMILVDKDEYARLKKLSREQELGEYEY